MKRTPSLASSQKERGKKTGKQQKSSIPKKDRLLSFIVFAFAFLLYSNTLNHGYVLDDDVVFLKNSHVQAGISGINDILTHSFTYGFTGINDQYQSYRPFVLIMYAIEKEFFGNNPHTGHFINVLLFALSCMLLFQLAKKIFPEKIFSPSFLGKIRAELPFLIALLFASHPIHTEVVANIKGRDEILNFIFFILSLTFLMCHVDEGKKKYFIASVLFFSFSLFCKEMAVTFLAIIPMALFFFRQLPLKKIAVNMIPFAAAFGIYMLIRSSILETATIEEKIKVVNNALAAATSESDRIATAILILGKYIQLLFLPHPLSWDYSYNQIPIVSFSDTKVISALCVLTALGVYSLLVVIKKMNPPSSELPGERPGLSNPSSQIFAFCILFFFIAMSVVSNIFVMIGATLGERFLFTPSLAFCIAIPIFFNHFGKNILVSLTGVVIILFSFKTFTRNKDWKDNFSLFQSGVGATPNSSRAESALGSAYRELAEKEPDPNKRVALFKQALPYYEKAIEILPENTEALYNAGVSYYGMGDKEKALKLYKQILAISPEHTSTSNNTGVIYFERKDYENAKKYFLQAVKYDPNNSDALGNLGAIHHNQGNIQDAISYYKKSLLINPSNQNVRSNLAKAEQTENNKKK